MIAQCALHCIVKEGLYGSTEALGAGNAGDHPTGGPHGYHPATGEYPGSNMEADPIPEEMPAPPESPAKKTAGKLAEKICNLRVFEDENGKMNLSLEQVGGALLVVSQFTLYADTSSRRPGFTGAAKPDAAIPLYEAFMAHCRERGFDVHARGGSARHGRWTPATTGRHHPL